MPVKTKAQLQAQADQISNETGKRQNTAPRVGNAIRDTIDTLSQQVSGITTTDAAANTAAIQAAIDAARAAYLNGEGPKTVVLPDVNPIPLGPSTSGEVFWNYGVTTGSANYCLVMRDGVTLRGGGIGKTVLAPNSNQLSCFAVVAGTYQTISDLEINGGGSDGIGNGIITLTATNTPLTDVSTLLIRNVFIHDCGGYGIGLQNGIFTNCRLENVHTLRTGADGIDVKARPYPTNDSNGNVICGAYVEAWGLNTSLPGQAAVDIRGVWHLSDITALASGAPVTPSGIRFRPASTDEGSSKGCTLDGFEIRGGVGIDMSGLEIADSYISVTNGIIETTTYGVILPNGGSAVGVSVANVHARGCTDTGFYIGTGNGLTSLSGVKAASSTNAFRNRGTDTMLSEISYVACSTGLTTDAGSLASERISASSLDVDFAVLITQTVGRADISARGTSANIDIFPEVKGDGRVWVGKPTLIASGVRIGSGIGSGVFFSTKVLLIKDQSGNRVVVPTLNLP